MYKNKHIQPQQKLDVLIKKQINRQTKTHSRTNKGNFKSKAGVLYTDLQKAFDYLLPFSGTFNV